MSSLMEGLGINEDNLTLSFGKYKGELVADIPDDYLTWMALNFDSSHWTEVAIRELAKRGKVKVESTMDSYGMSTVMVGGKKVQVAPGVLSVKKGNEFIVDSMPTVDDYLEKDKIYPSSPMDEESQKNIWKLVKRGLRSREINVDRQVDLSIKEEGILNSMGVKNSLELIFQEILSYGTRVDVLRKDGGYQLRTLYKGFEWVFFTRSFMRTLMLQERRELDESETNDHEGMALEQVL